MTFDPVTSAEILSLQKNGRRGRSRLLLADETAGMASHPMSVEIRGVDAAGGVDVPESRLRFLRKTSRGVSTSGTVGPIIIGARILPVVGSGLVPIISPSPDLFEKESDFDKWKSLVDSMFTAEIAEPLSVSMIGDLCDDLWRMSRVAHVDGDAFIFLYSDRTRKAVTGSSVCWKIIGGASVCNRDFGPNTDSIKNGIEYDGFGRAIAVWVVERSANGRMSWSRNPVFVNGKRVVHRLSFPGREAGAGDRSYPLLAPVIDEVNMLNSFRRAHVAKAVKESRINMIMEGDDILDTDPGYPDEARQAESREDGKVESYTVLDGMVYRVPSGNKIIFPSGSTPNGDYSPFSSGVFGEVCASCDVPPEVAAKLFGTSYSAATGAKQEGWRRVVTDRGRLAKIVREFYRNWLEEKIRDREIPWKGPLDRLTMRRLSGIKFGGPPIGSLNPFADAKARELLQNMGIITREINAAELGYDYYDQVGPRKREAEIEAEIEAGLTD